MSDTKERKIILPNMESFSHWPEIPYRWMMSGLVRVIERVEGVDANYLVALGLICYTEIVGHEILKFKGLPFRTGNSKQAFEVFLGEYMGYKDLLGKYPIYNWYRCGLCHEFTIKTTDGGKKSGPFHYFNGSDYEKENLKMSLGADASKGIFIASNGVRLFLIENYLQEFQSGIEKFLKESGKI
ncbi:MAG TPA: hypothetical protein VJB70_03820 [Candidatus Paceibacterota bacterium]